MTTAVGADKVRAGRVEEFSYGVIPLRRKDPTRPLSASNAEVFLIHQRTGRLPKTSLQWSFPKGHPERSDRSPVETARRELLEETNLRIVRRENLEGEHHQEEDENDVPGLLLGGKAYASEYFNPVCMKWKRSQYYAAEVEGDVRLQESEVDDCVWMDLEVAIKRLTWKEDKELLTRLKEDLVSPSP